MGINLIPRSGYMKKYAVTTLTIPILVGVFTIGAYAGESNWIRELSTREFQDLMTYQPPQNYVEPPRDPSLAGRSFPETFDWRSEGGVSVVKDQANCGSCWAFSATAVLESQVMIATGNEMDFSEQQLVDCVMNSYGCNGGNYENAWEYLKLNGFTLEADYPYEAENGECRAALMDQYISVTGWQYINTDIDSIKQAVMDFGPVSTVIGANDNLKNYTGGCYHDESGTSPNHAVTIVGWDDTVCDPGAWIVKNSWGDDWGDNGYFYIQYGDMHIGEYSAIAMYEEIPPVRFHLQEYVLEGDADGLPSAGEDLEMGIKLLNFGREDAVAVSAVLETTSEYVTMQVDTVALGDIPEDTQVESAEFFRFTMSPTIPPMEVIDFVVTIESGPFSVPIPIQMICGPQYTIYFNDFEGMTDEEWTHGFTARRDNWMRGSFPESENGRLDPDHVFAGEKMWGTNLMHNGSYLANMSNYLLSPEIDCSGHQTVFIGFWRWLTVEAGEYDHARIMVNDTEVWSNPYEAHLVDTKWVYCTYDISDIVAENPIVRVKFTLNTDPGVNMGGWNIDNFRVFSGIDADFSERFEKPLAVDASLSELVFEPGDPFELALTYRNYRDTVSADVYIALDVYGEYWFWPSWGRDIDFDSMSLSPYTMHREPILSFDWPDVEGHASGIKFWVAALAVGSGELMDYDVVEWGW